MANPVVQIIIRGANAVIIGNKVYAGLIPPPNAATWIVRSGPDGSFTFTDQSSDLVLTAPSAEPGTQAAVTPAGTNAAVSSWNLTEFSDEEGDNATPVKDLDQLESGYYTIQDPGTGLYLFRNQIEDYSLRPKFVGLQRPDTGPYELVIQSSA